MLSLPCNSLYADQHQWPHFQVCGLQQNLNRILLSDSWSIFRSDPFCAYKIASKTRPLLWSSSFLVCGYRILATEPQLVLLSSTPVSFMQCQHLCTQTRDIPRSDPAWGPPSIRSDLTCFFQILKHLNLWIVIFFF